MDEGKLTHLRGLSVAGSCQLLATSSDHFLAAVTGSYGSILLKKSVIQNCLAIA